MQACIKSHRPRFKPLAAGGVGRLEVERGDRLGRRQRDPDRCCAMRKTAPMDAALRRYDEIAQIVTGLADATAADGVAWVQDLCQALQVPSLACYGMTEADWPLAIEKSAAASSMRGNPIELTRDELLEIARRAL